MRTEMSDKYVSICKGHLTCVEDKCLRCHISKDNERANCYRPVFLNRDYFKTSDRKALERDKTSSLKCEDHIIDYYDCGQEAEG